MAELVHASAAAPADAAALTMADLTHATINVVCRRVGLNPAAVDPDETKLRLDVTGFDLATIVGLVAAELGLMNIEEDETLFAPDDRLIVGWDEERSRMRVGWWRDGQVEPEEVFFARHQWPTMAMIRHAVRAHLVELRKMTATPPEDG